MGLKDKSRISIDMDFIILDVYDPVRPRIKKSALFPQRQLSKKRLGNVVVNTPGSKNDRPPLFDTWVILSHSLRRYLPDSGRNETQQHCSVRHNILLVRQRLIQTPFSGFLTDSLIRLFVIQGLFT